jgi:demethylmenaquinone methyltransferase/2-methoxy-6-polyprenyl-1,4-benzoquinol methylase
MFDTIAPDYDRLNRWVSLGLDRSWRRRAVARMPKSGWIADWCAGTGDMAIEYLRNQSNDGLVVMCDFSREMRRVSGARLDERSRKRCFYVCCDVTKAPFRDGVFAGQMQGFAIRNLPDRRPFFAEVRRCDAADGRGALLDLSVPGNAVWRALCNFYFRAIAPRLVALLARRGVFAYRYLSESIHHHAKASQVVAEMQEAGIADAEYVSLAGGIGVIFTWGRREDDPYVA